MMVEIIDVYGDRQNAWVDVGAGSCLGDAQVTAAESDEEVRLTSTISPFWMAHPDVGCAPIHVRLKAPIGDRIIIDEFTDHSVALHDG